MAAIKEWQTFLSHSLASRLAPETFSSYLPLISTKHPLSSSLICDIFVSPRPENTISPDPQITRYLQALINAELVNIPGVLRALWRVSSSRAAEGEGRDADIPSDGKGKRWKDSYAVEEILFYRLAKSISSGNAPADIQEGVELVMIGIKWMESAISSGASANEMLALEHGHTEQMSAQHMALGTLLVAIVENPNIVLAISKGRVPKPVRKALSKTLAAFIPLLMQTGAQIAGRLQVFAMETMVAIEPVDKKEAAADKEIEDILDEGLGLAGVDSMMVPEIPLVNSRAGLYVYLNSLMVARPLVDDTAIFAYLNNRYQGDIRSTIVDLILAAFDVLANATFRSEKPQTVYIIRSFLINKIPLLLATLAASLFPPLTSEYCVTEALSQVDTTAFPTLSSMFDESSANNMFSDSVRQDFCFACCLHGLIAETSIEELLGDIPMQSLPAGGRYVKDDLVQQYLSDPARAEGMIDELEHMDGNVGAMSQAITEVIGQLASNKETMSLKTLCSLLVRKPSSLDVMLLFDKPITILQPVCDLLDNWRYDDDQGEYQPVYEEFGSILLLVLSFTHRFGLSIVDLGVRSSDSFVAKLLSQGHLSRALDDLTEQEQSHLDGWIRGLFDNESGGLGDELMSSCPPQDFYLLVPTLFHHIVLACSTKHLSEEGLKGGLEYLVDTFLLPSLIPGITWLASHLWESRGDANSVLQILSALITNPASISNNTEASQMLNAIMNIIAKNLEHSLRWLQHAEPSRTNIEPLSKALKNNLNWERRGATDHTELESWTATPGGGLAMAIKQTYTNLVQWGLNPAINPNPSNYTHRQILVGNKMLTAKRVLLALIEELKTQTEAGNASVALDVASAIICAPDAASWDSGDSMHVLGNTSLPPLQRRLTLREALKNEVENAPKLQKTDAFAAENIVRLYRKVEAMLVVPQQQVLIGHDALDGLEAGLDASALDAPMLGIDGLDGMNDPHADLMQNLMGGRDTDLLGFGNGDMGDGMGF